VDLDQQLVEHDAREVRTKFSKSFPTYFFPVGDDIRDIVADWMAFLRTELLFGFDDPLFPATHIVVGDDGRFKADGLVRKEWSNAGPIRRVFKEAFETAGLPAFNPHSLRKTLAQMGQKKCRTIEQMKAWSQNLGHEELMTTFASYGNLGRSQQAELGTSSAPRDLLTVASSNSPVNQIRIRDPRLRHANDPLAWPFPP
jgi:integrase/recombinase XerD